MSIFDPSKILSDIIVFNKYAKYIPSNARRETWEEICNRYEGMLRKTYPHLSEEISYNMNYVRTRRVLPSMRMAQFAGAAVEKNNLRGYNCSFVAIDSYKAFSDIMFLLLSGCGVGFSVQSHHVDQLPKVKKPKNSQKFLVMDSIEGWADAIKTLIYSYFGGTDYKPRFDFSDIRSKGSRLVVSGGYAPGPEPIKECLQKLDKIFQAVPYGFKLKPIQCHDIVCIIADAVLSGGIRRSALISLFDKEDKELVNCKSGEWWKDYPYRGRANNSVVFIRDEVEKEEFMNVWETTATQGYGEPGIFFSNSKEWGLNPCGEISLNSGQLCNLTSTNGYHITNQQQFETYTRVASFFGTLQAGYTDFHYVRPMWIDVTESEYLIGVSITGVASMPLDKLDLKKAAKGVKAENDRVAKLIGIKPAARTTTIKPEGSGSLAVSNEGWVSSGIHGYYSEYIIRRIQIPADDPLCLYFIVNHPELIQQYHAIPNTYVIEIPLKAPTGAALANESALKFLEKVKKFNLEWVREGHRSGANFNNVSATVYVKPNEWDAVGGWMWDNRDTYTGLSVLGYSDHKYPQAPLEAISKEQYEYMASILTDVDLTKVVELQDNTKITETIACAGGACEIV